MATTARITNIEKSVTKEELVDHLRSKGLSLKEEYLSVSLAAGEDDSKTATVSFMDKTTLKRAIELPFVHRILQKLPFDVDDDFHGFTPLSEGDQVDIVALHGMNGHGFNSWEDADEDQRAFMWLRDCLPERLPRARIMVYGHEASILSDISSDRLRVFGETFIDSLVRLRIKTQAVDRPLVFLAYSLGGLVLKYAFLSARMSVQYASILDSTHGVVFLGTPHNDTHILKAGGFVAMLAKVLDPNAQFNVKSVHLSFKNLRIDPNVVSEHTQDFRKLVTGKGIGVATFTETKKTKIGPFKYLVVDEQSAALGAPGERKLALNVDHIHLCKFSHPNDKSLSGVVQVVRNFCGTKPKPFISPQLRTSESDPTSILQSRAALRQLLTETLPLRPMVSASVRITNIESSMTKEDLISYFESKQLTLSPDQIIPFVITEGNHKSTTVSFQDTVTCRRALSLSRKDRKLKNKVIDLDNDFNGFTVLYEGKRCEVDIVALHGMNGHAFSSWECRDDNGYSFMWLRDCLPERIPNSRIMVYGYNANTFDDLSTLRIRSMAETFLERLHLSRSRSHAQRPLILLGHSLGGLIIKQTLLIAHTRADDRFESILNSVGGVLFIGTPHRGLNGIDEAKFFDTYANVFNAGVRHDLIAAQRPGSMALFDLTDDFRQVIAAEDIVITTLYESKKTKRKESEPIWIVDEQSAILGVASERKASINADHINLCRFEDSQDDSLIATIDFIQEMCADAGPKVVTMHCSTVPLPPEDFECSSVFSESSSRSSNSSPEDEEVSYVFFS